MIFRSMKNRLESSVPPEVLTQIQSEVNKNVGQSINTSKIIDIDKIIIV